MTAMRRPRGGARLSCPEPPTHIHTHTWRPHRHRNPSCRSSIPARGPRATPGWRAAMRDAGAHPPPCLPPSLERICLEALACSPDRPWLLQRRRMQLLPEAAANTLMRLLLAHGGRLTAPVQLDAFRHCLAQLSIDNTSQLPPLDAQWVSHIASLRHLHTLSLTGLPSARLKDKALTPLPDHGLASVLRRLDLSGCSGVTNKALPVIAQLTGLHALVLTGTSVRSPLLGAICTLTQLTELGLGSCAVSDDDLMTHHHLTALGSGLQQLDLSACTAGDAAVPCLGQLQALTRLSMAWSHVAARLPLFPGLRALDLSQCRLGGCVDDAAFVAASLCERLTELVLVQTELDGLACELLEGVLRVSASCLQSLDMTNASAANLLPLLLALEGATALTGLSLAGTALSDDFCPSLAACSRLQTLTLAHNPGVTAAGLDAVLSGCAASLRRLDLRGTAVGDSAIPALRCLPQLQQLVLADTTVSWARVAAGLGQQGGAAADSGTGAAIRTPPGSSSGGVSCWRSLRLLDLRGSHLRDAGCLQLVSELQACSSSTAGLQVLLVGGRHHKLGRRAVAAISALASQQHLTLQACQLTDRDLELLEPLGGLQQLHVDGTDPWLLSDAALLELVQALPHLELLTRDGRQLWQAAGRRTSASCKASSLWPAASLLDDLVQEHELLPWLWPHAAVQEQAHRRLQVRGVQPRPSRAADERHRYTSEQLLQLRVEVEDAAGDAHVLLQLPHELRASVRWS